MVHICRCKVSERGGGRTYKAHTYTPLTRPSSPGTAAAHKLPGLHPGGAQIVWVSFFMLMDSYWGRFLTLQLDEVGNVVIINLLQVRMRLPSHKHT